jgi:hypothetical protein
MKNGMDVILENIFVNIFSRKKNCGNNKRRKNYIKQSSHFFIPPGRKVETAFGEEQIFTYHISKVVLIKDTVAQRYKEF